MIYSDNWLLLAEPNAQLPKLGVTLEIWVVRERQPTIDYSARLRLSISFIGLN